MVKLSHVYKTYISNQHVLKNLKLSIDRGEFVFLMGPSGAGKTTLFRIMTGFEQASSGTIEINGFNLCEMTNRKRAQFRRSIGVVFQDFKLLYDRSVFENVALPLRLLGKNRWETIECVEKIIKKVGLSRKLNDNPAYLSGGEKQRVAIARALVHDPQLLIADEPTGNLDWKLSADIMNLFSEVNERGTTMMIATHDQSILENHKDKRLVKIDKGQLFEDGDKQPCGQYFKPLKEAGLSIL